MIHVPVIRATPLSRWERQIEFRMPDGTIHRRGFWRSVWFIAAWSARGYLFEWHRS